MTSLAWVTFDIPRELQGQDHSRAPQVGEAAAVPGPSRVPPVNVRVRRSYARYATPDATAEIKPNLSSILNEAAYAIIFRASPVQAKEGPDSWQPATEPISLGELWCWPASTISTGRSCANCRATAA